MCIRDRRLRRARQPVPSSLPDSARKMAPNPPEEALEGDISGWFRPPSARSGLRISHRLRIAAR
eukprot:1277521-Alexandrium_andersonii.AAC.1